MKILNEIWWQWKRFAIKVGYLNNQVIFTFLYFFIVFPTGVIVKIFSAQLKDKKIKGNFYWIKREIIEEELQTVMHQY